MSEFRRNQKRLGRLATLGFVGMSFLAGFIGGREIPKPSPPPVPAPIVYVVPAQQEIQHLSETVRSILKNAADKKITVEQAVTLIAAAFRVTLSNIIVVEKIRALVQRLVDTATNPDIEEATVAALKAYGEMSKPPPSPVPTATIVVPRN